MAKKHGIDALEQTLDSTSKPKVFGKYQYREAQAFLQDATLVFTNRSNTHCLKWYRKPDGEIYLEKECTPESTEWDYRLNLIDTIPDYVRGAL